MRVLQCFVLCMMLAGIATAANPPAKAPARTTPTLPNIILVTLDTTRADRMGFLGSQRGLTPNLDELARQGVVFTQAYSQVPLTPPSHATILTGTYPQFNHVSDFGSKIGADLPYMPQILRGHGYRTAAFVASVILDPVEGSAPGMERGFDKYDAGFHFPSAQGEDRYRTISRRADEVVARAEAWLARPATRPFFLWMHFFDAHDPYDPPEPFKSRYASAPYDGAIAYTDAAIGKFVTYLRQKGLYDGTVIAIMADHGEALGEHGEKTHGVFLYDETIHVPLLFKMPGQRFAGKRIDARAGLVDVLPTILESAGIAVPKVVQGESLVAAMKAPDTSVTQDRPAYAETEYPRTAFGWSPLRAWRTGRYLFVEAPRLELYDEGADPQARQNLASAAPAVTSTLNAQLDSFREKTASASAAPEVKPDPEAEEKLNALGYVGSARTSASHAEAGADPKDKIEVANLLHDATLSMESARYREAVPLLQAVVAKDPLPLAYVQLGKALIFLGNFTEALPVLRKAVELNPDSGASHYELGLVLFEQGDLDGAMTEIQAAIARTPKRAVLHFTLAGVYGRLNRFADAQKELETVIQLTPDDFRANLHLGRMLAASGKPADGLPKLKKAVKLQPNSAEAHLFLADAYAQLGQQTNAQRERATAKRLKAADGGG